MKNWKLFVVPFVGIIVFYRLFLSSINPGSLMYTDSLHHAYFGILILFIIGIMYHIKKRVNLIFFGLGLGLLVDEIFHFLSKGNGYQKYWNGLSTYGTAILMITIIAIYFIFHHIKEKRIKSFS